MASNADFIALKQIVKQRGLLEKQPVFYVGVIVLKLGLLALSLGLFFVTDALWFQILNALFMGFVMAQLGFTSHSACHKQCFNRQSLNEWAGLILGNLLLGVSADWWTQKHNAHHAHPNIEGMDPDLDVPVVVFTEKQAHATHGIVRQIVKFQAWLFFPLLTFQGYALREVSIRHLLSGKTRRTTIEALLIVLNIIGTIAIPMLVLGPWSGLVFILVSQAMFGVYLGSVFAPNHKGMLIIDAGTDIDFLRLQVLTARNVRAHTLTDFWYGGLNYQIEHHLFPSLPMHRLRPVSVIVKEFCAQRGISYHETSMVQSWREILGYLDQIGTVLRRPAPVIPASRSTDS